MVEKLMTNTVKDDVSLLPGIYSPRTEYQYSSIFVDTDTELVKKKKVILLAFSEICMDNLKWVCSIVA